MVVKIKQQLHCSPAPLIADPRHVDFIRLRLGESLPEAHKTGRCISPSRGGQFSCVDAHARVTLTVETEISVQDFNVQSFSARASSTPGRG